MPDADVPVSNGRVSTIPGIDIVASTLRAGVAIDQIEFEVAGAPPATAYLLGELPGGAQPVAIGLHHARGDKATLLPDLEHLASRGFLCVSIDSPTTRSAMSGRDHVTAFESQFNIALTALNLLQGDPDAVDHRVALIGRGIGGEVAASLAAHTFQAQVVVAIEPLPSRSDFLESSPHPLAAGARQFLSPQDVRQQIDGLRGRRLLDQLETASGTHWLLQVGDDDDRLSSEDRDMLALKIPRTVRVDHHRQSQALTSNAARRDRVDFVSNLCG